MTRVFGKSDTEEEDDGEKGSFSVASADSKGSEMFDLHEMARTGISGGDDGGGSLGRDGQQLV